MKIDHLAVPPPDRHRVMSNISMKYADNMLDADAIKMFCKKQASFYADWETSRAFIKLMSDNYVDKIKSAKEVSYNFAQAANQKDVKFKAEKEERSRSALTQAGEGTKTKIDSDNPDTFLEAAGEIDVDYKTLPKWSKAIESIMINNNCGRASCSSR